MGGVYPYIRTPQRRGFWGCIKLITPYYSRISCGTSILLNVRETRMDDREWIIQRHRKHWAYKSRDEDKESETKQNQKCTTQHIILQRLTTRTPPGVNLGAHIEVYGNTNTKNDIWAPRFTPGGVRVVNRCRIMCCVVHFWFCFVSLSLSSSRDSRQYYLMIYIDRFTSISLILRVENKSACSNINVREN
jgi:hypothetical protein